MSEWYRLHARVFLNERGGGLSNVEFECEGCPRRVFDLDRHHGRVPICLEKCLDMTRDYHPPKIPFSYHPY